MRSVLKNTMYPAFKASAIKHKLLVASSLLFTTLNVVLDLTLPIIVKKGIEATQSGTSNFLGMALETEQLIIIYGSFWTVNRLIGVLKGYVFNPIVYDASNHLTLQFIKHVYSLPKENNIDEAIALGNKLRFAQIGSEGFLNNSYSSAQMLIEMFAAVGLIGNYLGFIYSVGVLVIIVLDILLTSITLNCRDQAIKAAEDQFVKAHYRVNDVLLCLDSVKNYSNIDHEEKECGQALELTKKKKVYRDKLIDIVQSIQEAVVGIGMTFLLAYAGYEIKNSTLLVSDFIMLNNYLLHFVSPLSNIGKYFKEIFVGLNKLKPVNDILINRQGVDQQALATLNLTSGQVAFKNVDFYYDVEKMLLKNVSFVVNPGEKIGIVGLTGSGKSTIVKLLLGYYQPKRGKIEIDGQDIAGIKKDSLINSLGIVPQEVCLFNNSILYNVNYGNLTAPQDSIDSAMQRSAVKDICASKPEGAKANVGERGSNLSGGERQRIAIARVILKNPQIIIFDESTASLDATTERLILEQIDGLRKIGKTIIVVAHRLSTIADSDNILVVDGGEIKESGRHPNLIARQQIYARFWNDHSRNFAKTISITEHKEDIKNTSDESKLSQQSVPVSSSSHSSSSMFSPKHKRPLPPRKSLEGSGTSVNLNTNSEKYFLLPK